MFYFVEMAKGDALGEFEQIVLLAILRLREEAYGMTVRREIEERTGRECAIGAVYATLDRLETKTLVRSHESAPTEDRGGRPRKVYQVTSAGENALNATRKALASMMDGLKLKAVLNDAASRPGDHAVGAGPARVPRLRRGRPGGGVRAPGKFAWLVLEAGDPVSAWIPRATRSQ